jgi:hypothetical protein
MGCHGTKCPLLKALFLFLSFHWVTFLPEGVIVGFQNFAWAFNSQKKLLGGIFRGFFSEKKLELPEMARKLIGKLRKFRLIKTWMHDSY